MMKNLCKFSVIIILAALLSPATSVAQWVQTNGPYGGQVLSFAVGGTNIFTGTNGAGVFRSSDNGTNWTAVNTGLTNTTVNALAVIGTNLFAGTYAGVFLSTNDGISWTQTGLTNYIYALSVSGTNLFAGTLGGVYISTDNGASWTGRGLYGFRLYAIAISGTNLFVSSDTGAVFYSADSGKSWKNVSIGSIKVEVLSLAVSDSILVAGTNGYYVFFSTNNGTSWTESYSSPASVFALVTDSTDIIAGGYNGIFRSSDNGSDWTKIGSVYNIAALAVGPDSLRNLFAGTNRNGIFRSSDNGTNWSAVNEGLTATHVLSMAILGTDLFAGTDYSGIFRSTDNGASWIQTGMINDHIFALAVYGTNLFAGSYGVSLSTDDGVTWNPTGLQNREVFALAMSGTNLFAGTWGGVYRSSNNGISWTQTSPTAGIIQALAINATYLFAGDKDSGVFRSSDNGMTWSAVNSGLTQLSINSLAIGGTNLFAGTWGGGVYRSSDSGTTWTYVTSMGTYVYALAMNGTNLFAGTTAYNEGVHLLPNNGVSGTGINVGLSNYSVNSFAASGTNLFAGTFAGVWDRSLTDFIYITGAAGVNGSISPSGAVNVAYGTNQQFTFIPTVHYHVDSVIVDGTLIDSTTSYTFSNVTANHMIHVTFAINMYAITATAGVYGSISPSGILNVNYGTNQQFIISPSAGYHVDSLIVDGVKVDSTTSYTFTNVTASHTIHVTFAINTYAIIATAGANGNISPSGTTNVNYGGNRQYSVTPAAGYHADSVIVDGVKVDSTSSYTFTNVTATHTIRATFKINTYTIVATAGANGTITPSGTDTVNYGASQKFIVMPNTGYHVDSLIVDGVKVDSTTSYTFVDDTVNHTIRVTFKIYTYTITAVAGTNGTISPAGIDTVTYGSSPVFTFVPNAGYHVDSVIVDGLSQTAMLSDTLYNVTANHTIRVTFALPSINVAMNIIPTWNLVSLPVKVVNDTVSKLFPTRTSNAFSYNGSGYVIKNQMSLGTGYWLKFASATNDTLIGLPLFSDTIAVAEGWNLIGSISSPLEVSSITSNPPGMVTSQFFGYNGSYKISDTIYPGKGYWIKVNQPGTLILSIGNNASLAKNVTAGRIRIEPTKEQPPAAPDVNEATSIIPKTFALEQNYPNPFNPVTTILYDLPKPSYVTLRVYNILGQEVITLVNETEDAGYKSVSFDGNNLPGGLYFIRLNAGTFSDVKKMMLIK